MKPEAIQEVHDFSFVFEAFFGDDEPDEIYSFEEFTSDVCNLGGQNV